MADWAYGVTTCSQRLTTQLPRTLASLAAAGFDRPRLFLDGQGVMPQAAAGLPCTVRDAPVGPFGNWILAAWEIYLRQPKADMYALFQDDVMLCRNVRQYLERRQHPAGGYLNLFTFASNEHKIFGRPQGWHRSDQLGKGALALVFDHQTLITLFNQKHMVDKAQLPNRRYRGPGVNNVDGAVQHALVIQARMTEYVHQPSLVQHTGDRGTLGNPRHPQARTFPGEGFDALTLLKE